MEAVKCPVIVIYGRTISFAKCQLGMERGDLTQNLTKYGQYATQQYVTIATVLSLFHWHVRIPFFG